MIFFDRDAAVGKPVEKVDLHLYEVEPDRKLALLKSMLLEEDGSFLVSPSLAALECALSHSLSSLPVCQNCLLQHIGAPKVSNHAECYPPAHSRLSRPILTGFYRALPD